MTEHTAQGTSLAAQGTSGSIAPRKPWIASTLSQLSPGLGHIYCGEVQLGLTLFLAGFLLLPMVMTVLLFGSGVWASWALLGFIAVGLGLAAATSWHSKRLARTQSNYELKSINRWWIYALLAVQPLAFVVPIALIVKAHIIEAFYIPTSSMSPNLVPGDRLLVDKRQAGEGMPKRGEVVIFRQPTNRSRHYVKRVIGLPGEKVIVTADGRVSIDGQAIPTRLLNRSEWPAGMKQESDSDSQLYAETTDDANHIVLLPPPMAAPAPTSMYSITVPPEHVVVLGDNRANSVDSRKFGAVPIGDILGPATFIYGPAASWSRFGRIK